MDIIECIVCLEANKNIYKCHKCKTYICEECYIVIKQESCLVCRTELFNLKLKEKHNFKDEQKHRSDPNYKSPSHEYSFILDRTIGAMDYNPEENKTPSIIYFKYKYPNYFKLNKKRDNFKFKNRRR